MRLLGVFAAGCFLCGCSAFYEDRDPVTGEPVLGVECGYLQWSWLSSLELKAETPRGHAFDPRLQTVRLVFLAEFSEWNRFQYRNAELWLKGRKYATDYEADDGWMGTYERFTATLKWPDFVRLCELDEVPGRAGRQEFTIKTKLLRELRDRVSPVRAQDE